MDKKSKPQRRKTPNDEELADANPSAPRGASFDTEEGRAAQGRREDIAQGPSPQEKARDQEPPRAQHGQRTG
jgi:hypothetical protein